MIFLITFQIFLFLLSLHLSLGSKIYIIEITLNSIRSDFWRRLDWSTRRRFYLIQRMHVNEFFNSFYDKISETVDKHAPLQKLSKKQARSKGLLVSITKKHELYKSYLKNRNDYYFSKYKIYRNKLKHLLIISKKSYYNNYFKNNNCNTDEIYMERH